VSSRTITFVGFSVIGALWATWFVLTTFRSDAVTFGRAARRLTRSTSARVIVFLGWAWLGWHLFARGSGAFK
jgi:hypothetical protein